MSQGLKKLLGAAMLCAGAFLLYKYATDILAKNTCLVGIPLVLVGLVMLKEDLMKALGKTGTQMAAQRSQGGVEPASPMKDFIAALAHAKQTTQQPAQPKEVEVQPQITQATTDPNNPFELFDDPERENATAEIKSACKKAASMVASVILNHDKVGSTDTETRVAVIKYLNDEIIKRL